jgi:pyruvate formate lyase activating enzyme
MKEALHYKKQKGGIVKCGLCPRKCAIALDKKGLCGVRKNINGKLYSLSYGRPCAMHVDPIEKKPFYHFLPGSRAFSIATNGCNFFCDFCQNWQISQKREEESEGEKSEEIVSPEKVVELAKQSGCESISYTYTEPTIFYEYMLDIAKLTKKAGLKNSIVSNGYINEEPLRVLCKVIDAANIDLKGFGEDFYKQSWKATLAPVLKTLKILREEGVWLEITNLVIPGRNDSEEMIDKMGRWIAKELGRDVPLHLSAFHPDYKLTDVSSTPRAMLEKAQTIAKKHLDNVYLGNVFGESNTLCAKCGEIMIRRGMMHMNENNLKNGCCPKCGKKASGVWKI